MFSIPLITAILFLFPAWVSLEDSSVTTSPERQLIASLAATPRMGECDVHCRPCYFSTEAEYVDEYEGEWEDPYPCAPGANIPCPNRLTKCEGGGGDEPPKQQGGTIGVADAWGLAENGSPQALRELLRYSNVRFNQRRAAIQVFGCNSMVVAHMPLSQAQVRQLTE